MVEEVRDGHGKQAAIISENLLQMSDHFPQVGVTTFDEEEAPFPQVAAQHDLLLVAELGDVLISIRLPSPSLNEEMNRTLEQPLREKVVVTGTSDTRQDAGVIAHVPGQPIQAQGRVRAGAVYPQAGEVDISRYVPASGLTRNDGRRLSFATR